MYVDLLLVSLLVLYMNLMLNITVNSPLYESNAQCHIYVPILVSSVIIQTPRTTWAYLTIIGIGKLLQRINIADGIWYSSFQQISLER